ncbi:uncharacterized protein LOC108743699 [Agrilus planipennis]|uniref:Uncharacterized protein LOC108743699 n=1 Tax=Agrilus planipennis TaxID=224129 RepID=A0A1W4XQL7_AGRPL|nr:uncharacterized protein LOC108743699 [Agrilus planipennis]
MHQDFFNFKVNERYDRRKTEQERENDERYYQPYPEPMRSSEKSYNSRNHQDDGYIENTERTSAKRPELRQRTPSPLENVSPKDRFKDAKEKFLLMEKERLEQERIRGVVEPPISPTRRDRGGYCKDEVPTSPTKRYNHFEMQEKEKYFGSDRYDCEDVIFPKPAPRKHAPHQEVGVRRSAEAPVERYRMADKYDPKRRSMFNLTEEEHRRTCNEIAKELKRKSYMDYNNGPVTYDEEVFREADRAFHELPESERYTRLDQQQFSRSSADLDRLGEIKSQINHDSRFLKNQKGKNRHSYAEPKLRTDRNNINRKQYPEMVQRTNSSLSNNGRVGLASVHPY